MGCNVSRSHSRKTTNHTFPESITGGGKLTFNIELSKIKLVLPNVVKLKIFNLFSRNPVSSNLILESTLNIQHLIILE